MPVKHETKERVRKYAEVFTPWWLVKDMCDMLEQHDENAFQIEKTFLEPACGNGNFMVEILRRKFERCKTLSDATQSLSSVYGIDIQPDNVKECRERLYNLYKDYFGDNAEAKEILQKNVVCGNFLTGKYADNADEYIWFLADNAEYKAFCIDLAETEKRKKKAKKYAKAVRESGDQISIF